PSLSHPLSLHDALPIFWRHLAGRRPLARESADFEVKRFTHAQFAVYHTCFLGARRCCRRLVSPSQKHRKSCAFFEPSGGKLLPGDRKSTRLNSSHLGIS